MVTKLIEAFVGSSGGRNASRHRRALRVVEPIIVQYNGRNEAVNIPVAVARLHRNANTTACKRTASNWTPKAIARPTKASNE